MRHGYAKEWFYPCKNIDIVEDFLLLEFGKVQLDIGYAMVGDMGGGEGHGGCKFGRS